MDKVTDIQGDLEGQVTGWRGELEQGLNRRMDGWVKWLVKWDGWAFGMLD